MTPAAYVEKLLMEAPPLTAEQRDQLAELLRPVRRSGEAVHQQAA